ncbi:MAG: MFS transporter [Bdellovibrionales bacterium RIFCSPHIGHO2_01_FULL_40_29]|nr:MAG: MFS transporter [Bdellovibrionales bacterium RIFCSPHIGHO2_01_FULL_40_29]OFZ33361.1 MAG: MFS transporter [Bdellovibrionales bacterium RIFCSPHIGHO2_02_FULL_40_15]
MIEVHQLCKNYGERKAITNLNFKIEKGDVVGFLGPNGAGKSTTMKIITGFMAPSSGEARVSGYDVFENPIEVKRRIGYLPETPPLYTDMKVQDYLRFVAELKQVDKNKVAAYVDRALEKTQLTSVRNRLIQNLSKGFKQRVGIAQALVSDPEILIMDEPTVGLDPKQVAEIRDLIKELRGEHTIILSTHILPEVQAVCNKVIIIHQGQIVAQDSIEGLEKMNKGSLVVSVKTRNASSLAESLKSFDGVVSVEKISDMHFKVQLKEQDELIEKIASEVIRSGAGLLELLPTRANLEDVFLKLTYGQGS